MRELYDSDDDLRIPKSRAAVKLDLRKNLPARLSDVSRSDDDAQTDQGRRNTSNGKISLHASPLVTGSLAGYQLAQLVRYITTTTAL
jgi:hypothetical protein